jgi:outer membrane protein insertion porin family
MKKELTLLLASAVVLIGAPLKEIKYDGLVHISKLVADEMVGIKTGDQIDIQKIDESVKKFYEQGYFEDIIVSEEDGVLIFKFIEKPVIVNIDISGYGSGKEEKELEKEISLRAFTGP